MKSVIKKIKQQIAVSKREIKNSYSQPPAISSQTRFWAWDEINAYEKVFGNVRRKC